MNLKDRKWWSVMLSNFCEVIKPPRGEMAAFRHLDWYVLARRIPGTGEPVGLPSVGSHRVRHD